MIRNEKALLKSALTAMSAPNAGAALIQAGIQAYWGYVAANSAAIFASTSVATAPPGLGGIAANLNTAFPENLLLGFNAAMGNIAEAIHTTQSGGTATIPGSPPVTVAIT